MSAIYFHETLKVGSLENLKQIPIVTVTFVHARSRQGQGEAKVMHAQPELQLQFNGFCHN